MSLEEITEGFKEAVGEDSGLGSVVKFDFGDDGIIHVDAKQVPNVVSNDDKDADCTLRMALDDFLAMRAGELDGMAAFMSGKLKIEGDMSVAMKLQSVMKA